MKTDSHQQPALESYATFWEPIATESLTAAPPTNGPANASAEAKDAYLEFVNITEGVHGTQPGTKP
jgi:hypothetical protein